MIYRLEVGSGYYLTVDVDLDSRSGSVEGNLKERVPEGEDESDVWEAGVGVLVSLVLAHAVAGVRIDASSYQNGLIVALDALFDSLA